MTERISPSQLCVYEVKYLAAVHGKRMRAMVIARNENDIESVLPVLSSAEDVKIRFVDNSEPYETKPRVMNIMADVSNKHEDG